MIPTPQCDCSCHRSLGLEVKHVVACCGIIPSNEDLKTKENKKWQ
jgi:hypothetical protein